MVWMALVAPLVALTDVGDNRIRSLLLRLHGRRKCVFRLDRNRVALSLDIPSDCIPLHLLPLCGPHGCGVRRPLSIPERTRVPMPGSREHGRRSIRAAGERAAARDVVVCTRRPRAA